MKPSSQPTKRLSAKQIQCLEYVASGIVHRLRRPPVESLARKGLVEHTSLGWRVTPAGHALLSKRRENSA